MTIAELIDKLQEFSPDTKIVIRGYEEGYNDILEIISRKIELDTSSHWYEGSYKESKNSTAIFAIELYGDNVHAKDAP
jgi:hypothetical protein